MISKKQRILVSKAKSLLSERFAPNRHHAASAIQRDSRIYLSLHLDTSGHDLCAEASAIARAVVAGESDFDSIVSVQWDGHSNDGPWVVAPCGDCRQLLLEYAPSAQIVVPGESELIAVPVGELLPFPYHNTRVAPVFPLKRDSGGSAV